MPLKKHRIPTQWGAQSALLLITALGTAFVPLTVSSQPDAYVNYQSLTKALETLAQKHSGVARLESIGVTHGGRKLWVLEVAAQGPMPAADRPALFIAANLEGDQVAGSTLALSVVEKLLADAASDTAVKTQLANNTLYVLPRINPDPAEDMFAKVQTGRRTNTSPFDDDNDARMDEDGPEDLNGDGLITLMRVADPNGDYLINPDDPRLMKKADPMKGERGTHVLHWEGIDNDGDGFYNEDPAGGADINRNFQHRYPYYARDAGRHMVSEIETRAVMEFLIKHRNVAAMLVLGGNDNLIVAPNKQGELGPAREIDLFNFAAQPNQPVHKRLGLSQPTKGPESSDQAGGGERGPALVINQADRAYFTMVSEKYRELTGIKIPPMVRAPQGALFELGYYQLGVPSFSTPGWGLTDGPAAAAPEANSAEAKPNGEKPKPQAQASGSAGIDAQLLKWFEKEKIDGFVTWKSFRHPTLGELEIGGFKPYAATNPPPAMIDAAVDGHAKFVTYLTAQFARVNVAVFEAKEQGGGLYKITAEIENSGFLPTSLAHGVVSQSVKPTMVELNIPLADILAGETRNSAVAADKTRVPAKVLEGSGGHQRFEWLIKGKRGQKVELNVKAQKAGTASKSLTLP